VDKGGKCKCAHSTCFCAGLHEKQDLSRTEQRYVCKTAIKVNTTDTRFDSLDLFIASWITTHTDCKPGISN